MKPLTILFCLLSAIKVSGADLERGKTLYSQLCFNCHGPTLDGGQGPSLRDQYWRHGSSPAAILEVINKGVPGSAMIAYEEVFPEADRLALRDFILSEQEGMRETVRSVYPVEYFKDKRFAPKDFASVESLSQTPLPENHYYFKRNGVGVLRGNSKLYIKTAGEYRFSIGPVGRTSIFLNGEEVHYSDAKTDKKTHFNKTVTLKAGVHDLEIFHEEKKSHSYRFRAVLQQIRGKSFALTGRSLEGNIPKIINARPGEALVVRKWIKDLPPRTLMCFLPNQVIVALNPVDGQIIKAWHSAEINQTPSLPDRSAKPSEVTGTSIDQLKASPIASDSLRFLRYQIKGESALISFKTQDGGKTITISPEGAQSFSISIQ